MSDLSKQYHSIIFDEFNTWDDWHLVPTSRPLVATAEVDTEYVEIPGMNGTLDYTESLTGAPVFKDRKGSWEFMVLNGYADWADLYRTLQKAIHGKHFDSIILEDDPEYSYSGRLTLNEWRSEEKNSIVVIDYVLSPYRKYSSGAASDWLWDKLTLTNDTYLIYYGMFDVAGTKLRTIVNTSSNPVELTINSTANVDLTLYGKTYRIGSGLKNHQQILLYPGDSLLEFTGNARITLTYDRGSDVG